MGCSHLNLEPDLLPVSSNSRLSPEGNPGWVGQSDLGWGVGPRTTERWGSSLNSVHNGGQGDLGGHCWGTENSAWPAHPHSPSSDTRHSRARDDASREVFIASGFGGSSGPFSLGRLARCGGLWGLGSRRPWGLQLLPWPQLAPFLPLPMEGPCS